ncbi:MAG: AAA family ATPase [Veillonellaceae bacterium]|nr:AAA family ATPase [Veillonellaceae bacterium]
MKLSIENLAKIKKADIELNGITIIAGENDSGKSTVGKALAAMFSGFYNVNEYVQKERNLALARVLYMAVKNNPESLENILKNSLKFPLEQGDLYVILSKYRWKEAEIAISVLRKIALEKFGIDIKTDETMFARLSQQVKEILSLTAKDIIAKRLENKFNAVFCEQVNSLYNSEKAKVALNVQGKNLGAVFMDDVCKNLDYDISLMHDAIYIANPYLIDYAHNDVFAKESLATDLVTKIRQKKNDDLLNDIIRQKNLQEFLDKLAEMIPGKFVDEKEDLYLRYNGMRGAINVKNISVGVKAFAIIKRLLENGWLEENGVLVFDEPEIHVHPKWQVVFAEIIVLLQKHFNMTILLTTHSPYFINALEVYSVKYGIKDVLTSYLSNFEGNMVVFENVTKNMDKAYSLLAEPFNELEDLRFSLGMDK